MCQDVEGLLRGRPGLLVYGRAVGSLTLQHQESKKTLQNGTCEKKACDCGRTPQGIPHPAISTSSHGEARWQCPPPSQGSPRSWGSEKWRVSRGTSGRMEVGAQAVSTVDVSPVANFLSLPLPFPA